ncbi:MAG: DNA gyrase inhibitor YacG [Pseudomonadota bacterium]
MSKRVCAVCEAKPIVAEFKPFCSKRCADVDLSRWLKGGYAIPGRPAEQADEVPGQDDSSEA